MCYGPVLGCVSVCHKSNFYRNGWTDRAVFAAEASVELFCKEIRVSPEKDNSESRNWDIIPDGSEVNLIRVTSLWKGI